MPKNKGKGGKAHRRGKGDQQLAKRELRLRDADCELYGQVLKMLGNARLEIRCCDDKIRQGHIRGKMRKKVWIQLGDIILISRRDFQDDKCDVVHKYNTDEARELKALKEIGDNLKVNEGGGGGGYEGSSDESDEMIEFQEDAGEMVFDGNVDDI